MDDCGQKGDRQGSKMVAHARFNSVRIGTRARDLEDLDVDQEFMGFSLHRGFVFDCSFPSLSGVEMDVMQRVMLHECMPALCETSGDEPQDGVSKLSESLELCFATQIQSGARELCVIKRK